MCVCVSCKDVNISDVLLLCTNVKRKKGISQNGDAKEGKEVELLQSRTNKQKCKADVTRQVTSSFR